MVRKLVVTLAAFALVCASDLVCASERALFVPAFCQIGIVPEMGMMKLLPDLVGAQRAKELLFFGGKKIPELMKGIGKGVRSFKEGMNNLEKEIEESTKKE